MVSATVDAGALRHNLATVRKWAPRSRVMAVIKANAYGHGLVAVARALEETADAVAVARVDEGLMLRAAGINTATVLLEGVFDREQLDAAAGANFELVVHASEQIELLRDAPPACFKVWLKLDSGMNRLGFKEPEFAPPTRPGCSGGVRAPVNLFTHLATADEPELPATAEQLSRFDAAALSVRRAQRFALVSGHADRDCSTASHPSPAASV
jgi:alanine racemase